MVAAITSFTRTFLVLIAGLHSGIGPVHNPRDAFRPWDEASMFVATKGGFCDLCQEFGHVLGPDLGGDVINVC